MAQMVGICPVISGLPVRIPTPYVSVFVSLNMTLQSTFVDRASRNASDLQPRFCQRSPGQLLLQCSSLPLSVSESSIKCFVFLWLRKHDTNEGHLLFYNISPN